MMTPAFFEEIINRMGSSSSTLRCYHPIGAGKSSALLWLHEKFANALVAKRGFCECQNPTGECCHKPNECGWITFRRVGLFDRRYECHDCAEVNRGENGGLL